MSNDNEQSYPRKSEAKPELVFQLGLLHSAVGLRLLPLAAQDDQVEAIKELLSTGTQPDARN